MSDLNAITKSLSNIGGGALKFPLEGIATAAIELAKLSIDLARANRESMSQENKDAMDALSVKALQRADDIWEYILWEIGLMPAVEKAKAARSAKG